MAKEWTVPQHLYLSEIEMPAQPGHIPSLDGLRACSILLVLLSHFVSASLIPGGLGVYVFFVISGFLITRLLIGEHKKFGRISLANFYLRRALRLYPVVIAFTGIVILVMMARRLSIDAKEPLSALFYFANYLYADDHSRTAPFMIFWSLSIEEHFYFLLPAIVILLRGNPRRLLVVMALVCLGALALRWRIAATHPELIGTYYFYYRTEFRIDSLAFGVALSCLCELQSGRRFVRRLARPEVFAASCAVILACLLYRDDFFRETLRYTLLGIALTLMISYILFRPTALARVLNSPLFVWVGLLSYSLYLWHFVAHQTLTYVAPDLPRWPSLIGLFAISFAMAAASYYLLEKPLLRLRAKLRREVLSRSANRLSPIPPGAAVRAKTDAAGGGPDVAPLAPAREAR
jgi:peptidoglycan/LPS O-acetylase OafA/YrhL